VHVEVRPPQQGPPTGKDVMIDVNSDNYLELAQVTAAIRGYMDKLPELRDVEDTRPLPGIEMDLVINREIASRFGANAQTIGTAVQLVTNGILVGKYRPDDSQDEIDIRVRYPSEARGLHALDNLRITTADGSMVPMSNFVTLKPAQQVNSIERVDAHRVYHVRANVKPGTNATAEINKIKQWLATQTFPSDVRVSFKGGSEQQEESGAFLLVAAGLALFLSAIVLLALFNSFYPHHADPGGGDPGDDRRPARHGRDAAAVLHHHDGYRIAGIGGHRGEPQHRADRYIPSIARQRDGSDRSSGPVERAASASVFLTTITASAVCCR